MARITKRIIGSVGGSIGDVVIKYRNGKPYVASKPETTNTGTDPATIYRKNQGRFAGKLARVIYENEYFKKAWYDFTERKDYVYQNIFGIHSHIIRNDDLLGEVRFTPLKGFKLNNPVIEMVSSGIKIIADPIGENPDISTEIEKTLTAAGLIILKNENVVNASDLEFMKLQFKKEELDLTKPVEMTYKFGPVEKTMFGNFEIRKAYICHITLDENNLPVNFSEVAVGEYLSP